MRLLFMFLYISGEDNNNNNTGGEVITACPVLLNNILKTHSATFRHAYDTGCEDCHDYSNSVGYALPYLQSSGPVCSVHSKHHLDPESGHLYHHDHRKQRDRNGNARWVNMSKLNFFKKTDFRLICYLTGILLSFLVLIGVIVVLTLMVANKELGIIKQIDF